MNILVIGNGGREHAIAWKCAQSNKVSSVFVAQGNAGTAQEANITNIDISPTNIDELIDFAKANNIGLTIVGPEAPLVLGVVDKFTQAGLAIFGPTQAAARLEGSKTFAKDFLARHRIPTAIYQSFNEISAAKAYINQLSSQTGFPIVIKADGLAAGKGVIIAENQQQAYKTIDEMLADNRFGHAGSQLVIEEFLTGEEASFIVMVDGKNILPLATSQDHKARDNADHGPNTGGMGAYSPAPVVTPAMHKWIMDNIITPTVNGMANEGNRYTGFLYVGLMISPQGDAKVLEYNCRLGDPETQPIMMRLQSDLVEICFAAVQEKLHTISVKYDDQAAVGVVMAAGGYPDQYNKGDVIDGLTLGNSQAKVFHAGTKVLDGHIVTNGGRVLCATALGGNVTEAQQNAYKLVDSIHWDDVYFRTDIAYKAISREK